MAQSLTLRTSYFFAAQLVTSATNFVITLALSRALVPAQFGQVALVLTGVFFVLSFQRTVVGDSVLVYGPEQPKLIGAAGAVIVWITGATTLVLLLIRAIVPDRVPWFLVVVALLLLLQDGLRYVAVALHHARVVLVSDSLWLAAALVAVAMSVTGGAIDVVAAVWLAGGVVAAIVLVPTVSGARARLGPSHVRGFFRETRELSGWMALQYLVSTGAAQLALVGIAAFVGDADFGGLRAVQLLIAPVLALVLASASPTMAWLANRGGAAWTVRHLLAMSGAFALASAVPCVLLVVLAEWLLRTFPGPAYVPYTPLVLPMTITVVAVAASVPIGSVLRATGKGRRVLVVGLVGTVPGVVLSLVAAARSGILAATWVFVLQYLLIWGASLVAAVNTIREGDIATGEPAAETSTR